MMHEALSGSTNVPTKSNIHTHITHHTLPTHTASKVYQSPRSKPSLSPFAVKSIHANVKWSSGQSFQFLLYSHRLLYIPYTPTTLQQLHASSLLSSRWPARAGGQAMRQQ
jgi:hypothetical protein